MGKKGYILSGAALLAALTLLAGCGKNNGTEDKNKDKPDTDPAQEIVLVQPEAADVPVDFETAQKAWPDAYAYMKIPNATGCAIREGGFIAQHPVDDGWYLYRDLDGNDNKAGTLYTEATYNDTKLDDPVTVVYGHNMANRTMFGGLQSMLKNMDFSQQLGLLGQHIALAKGRTGINFYAVLFFCGAYTAIQTFPALLRAEDSGFLILHHNERNIASAITRIVGLTVQVAQIRFRVAGNLHHACILHGVCVLAVSLPLRLPEFRTLVLFVDDIS